MPATRGSMDAFASATGDRELIITRLLDAPRELVFDAWTNPEEIDVWWGPTGFRNSTHAMDVRRGGLWRYVMHGPDGTDHDNRVEYLEVVRPERLVYLHGRDIDDDPDRFHVTVTYADEGGKTRLQMRMVCKSAAMLQEMKKFGAVEGGQQTVDRLEGFLAQRHSHG